MSEIHDIKPNVNAKPALSVANTLTLAEAAANYARQGFRVFPCTPNAATPLQGTMWTEVATSDPDQVRHWWTEAPAANIGLACGQGVHALDLDQKHGGDGWASYLDLGGPDTPPWPVQTTPTGGRHLLIRDPTLDGQLSNFTKKGAHGGIDMRTARGYVVVAPSVRPEGVYRWADGDPTAPLPQPLREALLGWSKPSLSTGGTEIPEPSDLSPEEIAARIEALGEPYRAFLLDGVPWSGDRSKDAYATCCAAFQAGWTLADMAAIGPETHLATFGGEVPHGASDPWRWAWRYVVTAARKAVPTINEMFVPTAGPELSYETIVKVIQQTFPGPTLNEKGKRVDNNFSQKQIADLFWDVLGKIFPTGVVATRGEVYICHPQTHLWRPLRDVAVRYIGNIPWQRLCKTRSSYDAVCRVVYDSYKDPEFFDSAVPGIATPSGFYHVEPGGGIVREALEPRHRQTLQFPYEPQEEPPELWVKYLSATFAPNAIYTAEEQAEQIALLEEHIAATLLGFAHKLDKALLHYGKGRAGKGSFGRAITKAFPDHKTAVTAVSPYDWHREYHIAKLAESRLNLVGEMRADDPLPADVFKRVTGGDPLTGRAIFQAPFDFIPRAAHIFDSNVLPATTDRSDAFFERWSVIHFTNPCPKEKRDPGFRDNLAEACAPHLLYLALKAGERLLKRGRYLETTAHRRCLERWRQSDSALSEFLHDHEWVSLVSEPVAEILCTERDLSLVFRVPRMLRSEFYRLYRAWCRQNGHHSQSASKLYARIEEDEPFGITSSKISGDRCIIGVKKAFNIPFATEVY